MTDFDSNKLELCQVDSAVSFQSSLKNKSAQHTWVTVINPNNHRLLLQACDDCGVVKSENSVIRSCRASKGQALISTAMRHSFQLVG